MKTAAQASFPVALRERVAPIRPSAPQLAAILDPFIPAPAVDGARIYEATYAVTIIAWLCDPHAEMLRAKDWTLKLAAEEGAATPPWCDVCERVRQAKGAA